MTLHPSVSLHSVASEEARTSPNPSSHLPFTAFISSSDKPKSSICQCHLDLVLLLALLFVLQDPAGVLATNAAAHWTAFAGGHTLVELLTDSLSKCRTLKTCAPLVVRSTKLRSGLSIPNAPSISWLTHSSTKIRDLQHLLETDGLA